VIRQSSDSQRREPHRPIRGRRTAWSRRELLTLRRRKNTADGRWRVRIDADRCSDCGACVRICREAALWRRERDESVTYLLDAPKCNGCDDCAKVCAEQAVVVEHADQVAERLEVVTLPVLNCTRCDRRAAGLSLRGVPAGSAPRGPLCFACRQELAMLAADRSRLE